MLILWVLVFSLFGSVGAIAGAALLLVLPVVIRGHLVPCLISYATGTLLGAAFLGMIPAALEQAPTREILATVLAGMVLFFVLEKLVLWRHCHDSDCKVHGQAAPLILVGDAFHNFVDGVVIAAAFLTSIPLGVATAFAVIAHEIPQEVGDFAVLLHSGFNRGRAFLYNILTSLTTVIGGVLAYFTLQQMQAALPYVLAIAASSFIYIAVADLIPTLHRRVEGSATFQQVALIAAGILLIYSTHSTLH